MALGQIALIIIIIGYFRVKFSCLGNKQIHWYSLGNLISAWCTYETTICFPIQVINTPHNGYNI